MKIKILGSEDIQPEEASSVVFIENLFFIDRDSPDFLDILNYDTSSEHQNGLVTKEDTFKSIYELGKRIYEESEPKHVFDCGFDALYYQQNKMNKFKSIMNDWFIDNPFPYYKKDKPVHFCIPLAVDSLRLFAIYQTYKWILKLRSEAISRVNVENNEITLKETLKLLNFLEIEKIAENSLYYDILNYYNSPLDDLLSINKNNPQKVNDTFEESFLQNCSSNKNEKAYIRDINDFFEATQRILINYTYSFIKEDPQEFYLVKQKPVYDLHHEEIIIFETANSLIGIAYNFLLLAVATSNISPFMQICENPGCNEVFEKRHKRRFCDNEKCQRDRNRKKSYKNYKIKKEKLLEEKRKNV